MKASRLDLTPPDAVVTPGLIEAADRGEPGAADRAVAHAGAWLAAGKPLPAELRAYLYRRAVSIIGDSLLIEEKPL